MICTIALNSSIIMCSCVYTQKGTTLSVITNDFLSYVINKKRYKISLFIFVCAFVWFHKWMCYDFSSFIHWICECCVMFWRKVQWQNCDLYMWFLHKYWHDFETCYFFHIIADLTWFCVAFMVNEVALEQVSLSFSPVFLHWSPFHYWCILFSPVHLDV